MIWADNSSSITHIILGLGYANNKEYLRCLTVLSTSGLIVSSGQFSILYFTGCKWPRNLKLDASLYFVQQHYIFDVSKKSSELVDPSTRRLGKLILREDAPLTTYWLILIDCELTLQVQTIITINCIICFSLDITTQI